MTAARFPAHRVLIVDDNTSIHDDIRKILLPDPDVLDLDELEAELFDDAPSEVDRPELTIDSAYQGEEALQAVEAGISEGRPHCLAFVDMRMPPGWDGLETMERLWQASPDLQVVLCTAYSDHSWADIARKLARRDSFLILKKPFEAIELLQLASALTTKWSLHQEFDSQLARMRQALEREMAERQRMEAETRLSQKLQTVGQLAAGVAHEINTPIQYVADSVHFVDEAFKDLLGLLPAYEAALQALTESGEHADRVAEIRAAETDADLEYAVENVPKALGRCFDGLERVSGIVRAMKEFAHPDRGQRNPADLNRAIQSTLTVARNEYKYVADVEFEEGALPAVSCHLGELNQVFLNLLVNAAHAISDVLGDDGSKGTIRIASQQDGDDAVITISDTGGGIPDEIRDRVFDPFFTTKEVGRGTGQGLAIARSVIVDKHGGSLEFESRPGDGTTFRIRLPIEGVEPPTESGDEPVPALATAANSP